MKRLLAILTFILIISSCAEEKKKNDHHDHSDQVEDTSAKSKKKPLSPHTSTMAMVGDAHIHIDYSSPGVRGRIIFGGLLPFDEVWQAGAHMATWIETNKDLTIDGQVLPAGKYGFFTIPSKEAWTIIFNSNWDQHGKDEYDQNEDVIRFEIVPEKLEESVEHLVYEVKPGAQNEGTISLSWEKIAVRFDFQVN